MWFKHSPVSKVAISALWLCAMPAALAQGTIGLKTLEQIAITQDPTVVQLNLESKALEQQAIADGQWKDPRIKVGVAAIPIDTFTLQREAMTQKQIGVQQAFPRGESLRLKRERTQATSHEKIWMARLETMKIVRDVRLAYLEVLYRRQAHALIKKNQLLLKKLVEIAQFRYASGQEKQQRIRATEVALSRMHDRLLQTRTKEEMARATLSTWVPRERAFQPFQAGFPTLPPLPARDEMVSRLLAHAALKVEESRVAAHALDQQLSHELYKPGWMLDFTYGARNGRNPNGSNRSDFLTAMVSLDLPLFTENRQDRVHTAQQLRHQASQFRYDDKRRQLKASLESQLANQTRLGERARLFSTQLIPETTRHRETTLHGYQSRVTDLTDVVRAHQLELTTRLDGLDVRYQRLVSQVHLLYMIGDAG